ncbi:MAG: hypothetical protein FWD66_08670 [Paludibacter sp.]|nr:hypothetical protein [Paludibacter sp.]
MKTETISYTKQILENRRSLTDIFITVFLLGLGVNLIAACIFHSLIMFKGNLLIILGIFLCILSFIYLFIRFLSKKKFHKTTNGFFILDMKNRNIVDIDSYDFATDIYDYLNCAFSESSDIKKIWDNINFKEKDDTFNDFLKIMNEVSEYYLLEKLSTHLSSFFNDTKHDKNEIIEYQRNDIPDILLRNRFLEMFSKPMEDRAAFISSKTDDNSIDLKNNADEGKVVLCFSNGARYSFFDLSLPKNSKLKRNIDNSISIITKRFTITLKTVVSGTNTYIPWEFTKFYLGLEYENIRSFVVSFEINIIFKSMALFKAIGWHYYNWLDSFVKELEKDFEQEYYLNEKINWTRTYAIIKPLLRQRNNGKTGI